MRRFSAVCVPLLILLAGCRVEQTPAEYIDVLEIPSDDVTAVEDEIGDRLRSTAPALQRRSVNDLLSALAPANDLVGWGWGADQPLTDGTSLAVALSEVVGGRPVRIEDVTVRTGPRNVTAWFLATYEAGSGEDAVQLRFSGVFLRLGVEWRLVQAHISRPFTPPSSPEEEAGTRAGGG